MEGDKTLEQAHVLEYHSGEALMQHGPEALHEHVGSRFESAMGRSLPQMEVRFTNLNLSADLLVSTRKEAGDELPTLINQLKKSLRRFRANKYGMTKHILNNVSGVFKPGTITLVLGQPGSGKSALMKVLSGRFPMSKSIHFDGDVTYNGSLAAEMEKGFPQFVSYVTQHDYHLPTLTVKETLEFAHECCGGELPERMKSHFKNGTLEVNKAALGTARALYKHYPEVVARQLGLVSCQNTIVGNAMLRGVSGGERKRVTTGEMQFGNKFVTFMDEISTGLDSAATIDIIKTQRSLAKKLRKTVVIALPQPSPEVFALFDEVLILNDGYIMYHGPREQAMSYSEGLGFHRPPHRDTADFLMDIGTHQQHNYEVTRVDGSPRPRKARHFAEAFEKSTVHEATLTALRGPHDPSLVKDRQDVFEAMPEFHQSFIDSALTLVSRQMKVTIRNRGYLRGRAWLVLGVGFGYSTIFWQFDVANIQVVMGSFKKIDRTNIESILAQETHVGSLHEAGRLHAQWAAGWGLQLDTERPLAFFSTSSTKAAGVAIFLRPSQQGRFQLKPLTGLDERAIAITSQELTIVNVYAPNDAASREPSIMHSVNSSRTARRSSLPETSTACWSPCVTE